MEMNIEAAKLAEANKNSFYTGLCLNNIGNVLVAQNRGYEGLKYYKKALIVKIEAKDPSVGIVYNNIGAVWQNLEQMDSAEYYFNLAIPLRKTAQDEFGAIASQRNLAVVYEAQKRWQKALQIYREILPKLIAYEVTDYEAVTYFHLGRIYLHTNRPDSARYYMNLGRVLADSVEAYSVLQEGYGFLAKLDSSQNNFRQSFGWLKLKMMAADTIIAREKDKALTDMRIRYETEMAEQENTALKQEKRILEQEAALDRLWLYALMIGLILITFLAFTFYKNARLSKINLEQSEQLFELEREKLYEDQLLLEAQNAVKERENQLLQEKVASQNRELTSLTLQTVARNEILTDIKEQIVTIKDEPNKRAISHQIDQVMGSDDDWKQFLTHFNAVNPNFLILLQERFPDLSGGELKLCAYLRMNLSTKEIALLQNIEADSVFKARKRLRKKLNIADSETDLTAFLQAI
jgi:tetratricopeptide (TPR) repeat protein